MNSSQDTFLEKYPPSSLSFEGAGPDFAGGGFFLATGDRGFKVRGFNQQIHMGSHHQWGPTNDMATIK